MNVSVDIEHPSPSTTAPTTLHRCLGPHFHPNSSKAGISLFRVPVHSVVVYWNEAKFRRCIRVVNLTDVAGKLSVRLIAIVVNRH